MRIALGQLWQETNTFNPLPTTRESFEQFGVLRGQEMIERMATTNELGGFIQSLRQWPEQPELVGLARLPAWPGGPATAATFDWLRQELIDALRAALPVDAVLLALHGAMAADQHPDVEGEILTEVRQIVGPSIPIVATLDLHTNVTDAMVRSTNALVLYHTAPHIDVVETGTRAAHVLRRILVEGARPITAFQKIPASMPAEIANTQAESGVSVDLKRALVELETQPTVLTAGLATVQPWLDIPDFGSSVLVTTDGDEQLARRSCAMIAAELWRRRCEYLPQLVTIEDAVAKAHANPTGLVVLSDAADATTSGAPGDSVWILRELLKYTWPREALVTLVSPATVALATQLGSGQAIHTRLGGVRDTRFGTSIEFDGQVVRLFDASFVLNGHLGKNMPITMGPSAVLRQGNVHIVVTTLSGPHFAPELFQAAGFDPFAASVLIAKSPCGFRAVYSQRAAAIYSVRAPGCAPTDFWKYPFEKIPHPTWPWDEIEFWEPRPVIFKLRD